MDIMEKVRQDIYGLTGKIFSKLCMACGGNWYAMYWSGYKRAYELGWITAEELDWFDKESDRIQKEKGSEHAFCFLVENSNDLVIRHVLQEMTK